jgi:hypothetical protein
MWMVYFHTRVTHSLCNNQFPRSLILHMSLSSRHISLNSWMCVILITFSFWQTKMIGSALIRFLKKSSISCYTTIVTIHFNHVIINSSSHEFCTLCNGTLSGGHAAIQRETRICRGYWFVCGNPSPSKTGGLWHIDLICAFSFPSMVGSLSPSTLFCIWFTDDFVICSPSVHIQCECHRMGHKFTV